MVCAARSEAGDEARRAGEARASPLALVVPVVDVGVVRVPVHEPCMAVRVRVGLLSVPGEVMRMPMMLVVRVVMVVLHRLVHLLLVVAPGEGQPDTRPHHRSPRPEKRPRAPPPHKRRARPPPQRPPDERSALAPPPPT